MLQDRRALITGASRGIGLGIARGFARAGAVLHLLADDATILDVAATLGATGHVADISDAASVETVARRIGALDVLVNNAGLERLTPLDDAGAANEATFRRILEINVTGTFLMTRAVLPHLARGGRIINTASVWGRVAEPLFGAYVASKHAVIGLTKTWARELGPRGITVNAVAPGWVRTEASLRSLRLMAERNGVAEEVLLQQILAGQALPGLMEPDDMAGPYLFLASDLAANVTGQTLGADRGEVPW
ncbi:MAG TPA: SDR family oxidoreductase [Acetobacteraceae bacterium]|nr:SDR family oxidoreductase [Acetobacteraceae bacterium]